MASEKDLLKISVQEREYMEIDVKREFHAVISRIFRWQIASSEVSDEVYALDKEQYIIEAASLQSKLTEVYIRLEANVVYPLSSSEKKKRDELMEELSYEINYLSNITPVTTDCYLTDASSNPTEQVDTDQQSTALLDTDYTDQLDAAIDLAENQDTASNSTGNPTTKTDRYIAIALGIRHIELVSSRYYRQFICYYVIRVYYCFLSIKSIQTLLL